MDMARLLRIFLLATAMLAAMSTAATGASAKTPRTAATRHTVKVKPAPVGSRNPVTTAAAIAEGYWHAVPCGGQITIEANRPLVKGLDPTTDGWVTFNSSLGPDNLTAPASTYSHCTITLAHWQWPTWRAMESDWGMFCLTMVHEMGHLLGHKHSLKRGSVMAPVFTSDANVPALCNSTWLAGWRYPAGG